jgi:hypothetical protein
MHIYVYLHIPIDTIVYLIFLPTKMQPMREWVSFISYPKQSLDP